MSLTFNSVNSDSLGVIVEKYPPRPVPQPIVETIRVAGRNGALTRFEGYENVIQDYEVYLSAAANGLPSAAAALGNWLLAPIGYCRLEDSYNPNVYRMARLVNPQDIRNTYNRFGRITLSFDCMPQRFLVSGETATTYTAGATITNPTVYESLPLITVVGSGDCSFSLGGYTVAIEDLASTITIDCEAQNCYDNAINLNSSVTLTDGQFPKLSAGANTLAFVSGSITSITITPRWYEL